MFRPLAAALVLAALCSAAAAADLPGRILPAPVVAGPMPFFAWTGFSVGVSAGDAFAAHEGMSGRAPGYGAYLGGRDEDRLSTSSGGLTDGGHIGDDDQSGVGSDVVACLEAEFVYTDLSTTRALPTSGALAGLSADDRTSLDGIRGQLGYGFGSFVVCGTGGLADRQVLLTAPGGAELPRLDVRDLGIGYAAGGGLEHALPSALSPGGHGGLARAGAVTLRAEYLRVATGQHAVPLTASGQALTVRMRDAVDLGRAGINYKL